MNARNPKKKNVLPINRKPLKKPRIRRPSDGGGEGDPPVHHPPPGGIPK